MAAGTWTIRTDMPSQRHSGGGAGLGPDTGYFYYGNKGGGRVAECHEYNKVGDFWTQKVTGTNADDAIPSFSIGDDKAYAGPGNNFKRALNEFSKSSNAWTIKASLSSDRQREHPASCSLGLSGYFYGGTDYAAGTPKTDEYSQASNAWTAKADGPSNRYPAMCPITGELILSAYGWSNASLQTANLYSLPGDSWSATSSGPSPARQKHTAQALTANNTRGYFIGGERTYNTFSADCDEYDLVNQIWESKANMPGVNYNQLSAAIGSNSAYVVGGRSDDNVCWEFAMPRIPEVTDFSPAHEQTDVAVDSNIQFDLTHPDGIDPDTINVQINGVDVIVNGMFQPGYSGSITEI